MQDATDLLFEYLEAKRHLWNTHFVSRVKSLTECRFLDRYESIDRQLFTALVLESIETPPLDEGHVFGVAPIEFLRVVPKRSLVTAIIGDSNGGRGTQWIRTVELNGEDCEFVFIEFFEWDRYGYVAYPYIMARIAKSDNYPELVSKDCLIEGKDVTILVAVPS